MHIESTTHEHGRHSKVFVYEADYTIHADRIEWSADISSGDAASYPLRGSVPITTPAVPSMAEQVVRDAIVARIDAADDRAESTPARPGG